jgi:hypothetical protein
MTAAAALRETLISSIWLSLKPRGFKRRGANFHRPAEDVVHLISLQSSRSGTRDSARVTVNLAVWCKILDDTGAAPSVWTAHWRKRIGHLMPANTDLWWSLPSDRALDEAATEIVGALEAYGLPALDCLASAASLLALWDSGESPGLTRGQVTQYAVRLRDGVA